MKNILIIGICCALPIVLLAVFVLSKQPNPTAQSTQNITATSTANGTTVGDTAADFTFQTVDGKTVDLSSLRGEPVMFSFVLTTGCTPCEITATNIRDAQKEVPFKVIQLAVNPADTAADLQNFKNTYGAPDWFIGYDEGDKIATLYNVRAVDTKIIVDSQGKIVYRDDGYPIDVQTIVQKIKMP